MEVGAAGGGVCFLLIPRQRFRSLLISSPVGEIRRHACARSACTATLESDLVVVDSRDLLESLLPDHDGGEVGGVAGEHQQAEDGPEVHEEAPGPAFRRLQGEEKISTFVHFGEERRGGSRPSAPRLRSPLTPERIRLIKTDERHRR